MSSLGKGEPMFGNEEIVRFESIKSLADLQTILEDYLSDLGDPTVSRNGGISLVSSEKYNGNLVSTEIYGNIKKTKDHEFRIILTYKCFPTGLAWIIVILGVWFYLLGLIALIPAYSTKIQLEKDVRRALSNLASFA